MVASKNNKTNMESKLDSTKEVFNQNEAFEKGLDEIDIGNQKIGDNFIKDRELMRDISVDQVFNTMIQ